MTYLVLQILLVVLAIGAAAAAVAWTVKLVTLSQHKKILRDAEALKLVDLSAVITAHVPVGQRTQNPQQEIAAAKEIIARKGRQNVRRLLISSAALAVIIGANMVLDLRETQPPPGTRGASVGIVPPTVDALAAAAGKWGWKFNALMSCTENPHTIFISPDRHKLSIRFAKSLTMRGETVPGYDLDILGSRPNELILRQAGATPEKDAEGRPVEWIMHFDDQNTYVMKRSVFGVTPSGQIGRCAE